MVTILLTVLLILFLYFVIGIGVLKLYIWVEEDDDVSNNDAVVVTLIWPVMLIAIIYYRLVEIFNFDSIGNKILKLINYKEKEC